MLSIVACLRHPATANDFGRVNQLLQKTIDSLKNQSNQNFQLIIVCNEGTKLSINTGDIDTQLIFVDFPPTEKVEVIDDETQQQQWNNVRKDKGTKYLTGINTALSNDAEFIAFIDADDYLHKDLVTYIYDNKDKNDGFIINKGFGYKLDSNIVHEIHPFHHSCGTCNVYRANLFKPYLNNASFANQNSLLSSVDDFITYDVLGSHKHANELFEKAGATYNYIPFEAAMYIVDNGENDSGISQVTYKAQPLTKAIIDNFSLQTQLSNPLAIKLELLKHYCRTSIKKNNQSKLIRAAVRLKQKLN
ncbi:MULTISPECIES: glycosyltransferase family A protein [unclassified Agarivorans]|uniref:glycosyltransferase family A protein n=1 Tax=unclassified Agarivorans TaxID=2636026 RepID=UPI0026E20DBA|nr:MULTISPECIES: glycosyltransferase family A protein [unclassified Agarivorans]MDO6687743.1 glycosyltransferase family A protein [Agarivorans sp. 3_MG-2023]MDO6717256.1 glycosyltransferase family A protein [Agarivorans sp. 2_MG-2023]